MHFDVDFSLNNRNFKAKFGNVIEVGGDTEASYNEGYEAGQKAEYDRFWDNYQQNGNRIDYSGAFYGRGWNAETFKPKYKPMKPTSSYADRMFFGFSAKVTEAKTSITPEIVDFSQCRLMDNTFKDSTFDTVIADLSNATSLNSTFNMGNGTSYGIRSITLKVTEKCTSFNVAFAYAYNMEELFFTEDSVIAANLNVKESSKLTYESIDSIINALQDRTGTTALKITFHTTAKNKLTEAQYIQIAAKNWQVG